MSKSLKIKTNTFGKLICPVKEIFGSWIIEKPPHHRITAWSTPGHLIHLIRSGEYELKINERSYIARKGDLLYYYETEMVEWIENLTKVSFYSISFSAPGLSPLPFDKRKRKGNQVIRKAFENFFEAHQKYVFSEKAFIQFECLMKILSSMGFKEEGNSEDSSQRDVWWEVEALLRRKKLFRPNIQNLVKLSGKSRTTLFYACRKAFKLAPLQRIQILRMEEARGLLMFSPLNISEIANYLGYPRIHEFSREFSAWFGCPPTQFRNKNK